MTNRNVRKKGMDSPRYNQAIVDRNTVVFAFMDQEVQSACHPEASLLPK